MDNVGASIGNDRVFGGGVSGPISLEPALLILFFLFVFLVFSYLLKREYWKDLR